MQRLHPISGVRALIGAGAVALVLAPALANAQSDLKDNVASVIRKLGVHGNVSLRQPVDPDVTKGSTFGPQSGSVLVGPTV